MKRGIYIWAILLLSPLLGVARNDADKDFSIHTTLNAFLSTGQHRVQSIESFDAFISRLDKKFYTIKKERDFLQYVFSKTHQRFLKNYSAYASLDQTFETGAYNCLTGTILYSLILHQYNIPHEVIETNYHIFILAETKQGRVLLEATDPLNGFVSSPREIEKRISQYKQNKVAPSDTDKAYYKFQFELFNTVSLDELRGLMYYNMAVHAFNQHKIPLAVQALIKADALYASSRIDEFSQLMLLSLQRSTLDPKTKEDCMTAILAMRQKTLPVAIASN